MESSAFLTVARRVFMLGAVLAIVFGGSACSTISNTLTNPKAIAERCHNACEGNWGPGDGFVNCQTCQQNHME